VKKLVNVLIMSVFAMTSINAQFTKFGGGLGISSGFPFHQMPWHENKSGNIIASVNGIYELNLPFHISPSFMYLLPHITRFSQPLEESTYTVSSMMFDINGHYVFNSLDRFELYGLAGLDVLLAWKKQVTKITGSVTSKTKVKESDNAIGLNIGAGTYLKITEQIDLFIEAKYIVSKYDQFMFNAGVLINLEWFKKNQNTVK
jgi:hypothetical protein